MFRSAAVFGAVLMAGLAFSACSSDSIAGASTEASLDGSAPSTPTGAGLSGFLRLRCEVSASRSKVSVDGNNLTPANAMFSARIQSGDHVATAGALQAVGDEVEFDFDSNANDIAAGATAISPTFIQVNASGPDVVGEIINAGSVVVATASAECEAR